MTFKAGRLAEILLDQFDMSAYLNSVDMSITVDVAEVSTFKSLYKSWLSGLAYAQQSMVGYYDPTSAGAQQKVRAMLQVAPSTTAGIVSFAPAGATAIGDNVRLFSINSTNYQETEKTTDAVGFNWTLNSTAPVGIGQSLHPLAQEALGTITGTGDGCGNGGVQTTTGAIGQLHVTQVSSAVASSFKFQDATTQGGAYTDIASGAFTNMTAVGAQRLVIPGTIRQFVRCLAVIGPATTTYAVSFART